MSLFGGLRRRMAASRWNSFIDVFCVGNLAPLRNVKRIGFLEDTFLNVDTAGGKSKPLSSTTTRYFSSESSHGEVLNLGRKDGEIYQSEREKMVQRYKGVETASKMQLNKLELQSVRKEFAKWSADTGSSGVQIAILTARISYLTEHLKQHKKDLHSKRGLTLMLEKRKKLLKYLRRTDAAWYEDVIVRLSLKDRSFSEEPLGAKWPTRRKRS